MGGHVKEIDAQLGFVRLTQNELDFITNIVEGKIRDATSTRGSTQNAVVKKIRNNTGWEMKSTPLICRFAYAFGLVKL